MSKKLFALAAIFMLIAWAAAAQADIVAYDVPAPSIGNQPWTGSLGMDFNVNSPVTITALGVYDSGQDGISGTLSAVIYNRDTGQPVTKTLSFTTSNPGTLNDGSRFLTLTFPVTLVPGNYSVVSWGYSASDLNGNLGFPGLAPSTTNNGGGLISFVSARFSAAGTGGVYPTGANGYSSNSLDGPPVNRYYAGTFEFAAGPPVSTIAYNVPTNTTGNQAWTGSLGMDFDVLLHHAIKVTALGVYDSGQNGIISGPLYAVIYNRDTGQPVTSVLSFTTSSPGTLIGGSLFKTLNTPVILPTGDYSIVSWGYSASDPDGNLGYGGLVPSTTTGNGLISFVGSARFSPQGTGGVYPTGDNGFTSDSLDGGPDNRYYAGTFEYTAVPLPPTLLLLGSGMAGLGLLRFRRKA